MAIFTDNHGGCCACAREKCTDECATFKQFNPKPTTNYDRIISKTPEELAEWLEAHCYQYGWLDWLKQEATD